MRTNSGKTLTIFAILIVILLASSTSIGFFLYHKEAEMHRAVDIQLNESNEVQIKLQAQLKEAQEQLTVLADKNKEADEKINNLIDEEELNKGLNQELKGENAALKDALDAAKKDKEQLRADTDEAAKKYKEAVDLLRAQQEKDFELSKRVAELEAATQKYEAKIQAMKADLMPYNERSADQQVAGEGVAPGGYNKEKVELDKIVVNPNDGTRGRILSVDKDAEFIVCNLGMKQGVKSGDMLSVYRGEEYLGDVKVSRVQQEMSAADIVPPFSSRKVRKNDIVVFRP